MAPPTASFPNVVALLLFLLLLLPLAFLLLVLLLLLLLLCLLRSLSLLLFVLAVALAFLLLLLLLLALALSICVPASPFGPLRNSWKPNVFHSVWHILAFDLVRFVFCGVARVSVDGLLCITFFLLQGISRTLLHTFLPLDVQLYSITLSSPNVS